MDVFIERCAGLDVHSETIVACVICGNQEEDVSIQTETFPTLTKDLFRLLKWLESRRDSYCHGKYWCILETSI